MIVLSVARSSLFAAAAGADVGDDGAAAADADVDAGMIGATATGGIAATDGGVAVATGGIAAADAAADGGIAVAAVACFLAACALIRLAVGRIFLPLTTARSVTTADDDDASIVPNATFTAAVVALRCRRRPPRVRFRSGCCSSPAKNRQYASPYLTSNSSPFLIRRSVLTAATRTAPSAAPLLPSPRFLRG